MYDLVFHVLEVYLVSMLFLTLGLDLLSWLVNIGSEVQIIVLL